MSWYLRKSGQPVYAVDGSSYALVLISLGSNVLDDAEVPAAITAWNNRTPGPVGTPPSWATQGQLAALRAELLALIGGGTTAPTVTDLGNGTFTAAGAMVTDNGNGTFTTTGATDNGTTYLIGAA